MVSLVRTESGIFRIEDALDIENIKEMSKEEVFKNLIDTDVPLVHFGKIKLNNKKAKDFVNGKKLKRFEFEIVDDSNHQEMYNIYYDNEFLGVAKIEDELLKSHKVFNVRMQNEDF